MCSVSVTTAYAMDSPPIPALAGLAAKLAPPRYGEEHSGVRFWNLGYGFDADAAARKRIRVTLKELHDGRHDVVYSGGQQGSLSIAPQISAEPVQDVAPAEMTAAGGAYYARVEGTNWQNAWASQRSHHRYLVIVSAKATFAEQDWSAPSPVDTPRTTAGGSNTAPSGVSFEELRRLNLRYADRDPFSGDGRGILKDEARMKEHRHVD